MKHLATYQKNFIALGSEVDLTIVTSGTESKALKLLDELELSVYRFERRFSRFLPGSELSRFNRQAGSKQITSPEFHELLLTAQSLMAQTDGLFNPFILPTLQKIGYKQSMLAGHQNDLVDDHSDKHLASINKLEIGDNYATIPYGTALDFGGIGKGYLADLLVNQTPNWVDGLWYSLGGDIITCGHDQSGKNWRVDIINEITNQTDYTFKMPITKRAVATSGTLKRRGVHKQKAWHHIIDPRTGRSSVSDVLTATVVHDSATSADVLATCSVILGSTKGIYFLKNNHAKAGLIRLDLNNTFIVKKFGLGFQTPASLTGAIRP